MKSLYGSGPSVAADLSATHATAVLPDGYTVRPPEPADAGALFGMLADYNTALVGFADCTLDEVAEGIVEPGFDRAADCRLVLRADGVPAGYATTLAKGDGTTIEFELSSREPAVAAWLFEQAMSRAQEMGRERGHAEVTVDVVIFRADDPLRALLTEHQFSLGTTYHRMRIDHTGPVATPEPPAGVEVRRGAFDAPSRWVAHEVMIEAFRGQFGWVPRPHDEWVEVLDAQSTFDWSQLTTLEADGRTVAVRMCTDGFIEAENCGYVGLLGVLEGFRGRGLATYMLHDAFARDAAAGRAGTILHVDTNNPSPALGLYLRAGMSAVLVFDGWRRVLSVA